MNSSNIPHQVQKEKKNQPYGKKQAPISLITNPNSIFIKTKLNNIARSYLDESRKIQINHNKKNSYVKTGNTQMNNQKMSHVKYKTNILTTLNITLGTSTNKTQQNIISPKNSLIHNKPNNSKVITMNSLRQQIQKNFKKKMSVMNNSKEKSLSISKMANKTYHNKIKSNKQVNSTFNNHLKTKTLGNSITHSIQPSFQIEEHIHTVSAVEEPRQTTNENEANHTKNCLFEMDVLVKKPTKRPIKRNKTINKNNKKLLEIKTSFGNNIKDKLLFISSRAQTTANNIQDNAKVKTNTSNLNNSSQNAKNPSHIPPKKKEEPKKNKIVKCPLKLNLLSLIQENTQSLHKEKENQHSLLKNKSNSTYSIDNIESVINNPFIDDTKFLEFDNFDDMNSIIRKIPFDKVNVKKENIFSVDNNTLYETFCTQFESKYENSLNKYKNSAKRTNVNISGSTCENSSKKYFIPVSMLNKE